MKKEIHPEYKEVTASCVCGNSFKTMSTKEIRVEICSECHPFFTGSNKIVDSEGRVDKFQKKFKGTDGKTVRKIDTKTERKLSRTSKKIEPKKKKEIEE